MTLALRAERAAFGLLVLAAFGWPLAHGLKETCVVLASVAWLISKAVTRTGPPRLGAMLPVALWFAVAALSMINSVNVEESLHGLQKIIKVVLLMCVAADVMTTRRRMEQLIAALMGGAVIASIDGLAQFIVGKDLIYGHPIGIAVGEIRRLSGPFTHGNDFAVYAVTILPLCLVMALDAATPRDRWLGWTVTGLLGTALLLAFSRSGMAGLCISLSVLFLLRGAWQMVAAGSLAAALALLCLPPEMKAWAAAQGSLFNIMVMPQRPDMWRTALHMIQAHPWIGVGVNTFVLNYAHFKPAGDEVIAAYAHNQYLHRAAETGLIGLAALLWLLASTGLAWRRIMREADAWTVRIASGLGCGLISFLVMGLFESALQSSRANFGFWVGLGILQGWALRPPARSV